MSGFRKPEIPRGQQFLFPPRVEDFVGALSHVRLVEEVLRQEAFQKTFRDWASLYDLEAGRPAYSPFHLTAIYVYGAMHGILSSRKLEAACRIRIDFKWLAEGLTPDHSTIANFLKKHADQLDDLFRDVLEVAKSMGLLKGEHVSVDGTKLEANASRESVKREAKIKAELEEYERLAREIREKWQENDELEDRLFGDDEEPEVSGPEAARKLEAQRRKMKEALAAIERRRNEASRPSEASDRGSVTDPDARHMKDKRGRFAPGYNVQLAVDREAGLVTAVEVNDRADDSGQLLPMVEKVKIYTGALPKEVSADKAYNVGSDLEALQKAGVEVYVPEASSGKPTTKESKEALEALQAGKTLTEDQLKVLPKAAIGMISKEAFKYISEEDAYRCPAGQSLVLRKQLKDRQRSGVVLRNEYRAAEGVCASCHLAQWCCKNPEKGRMVTRDQYEKAREQARQLMETEEGRKKYAQRSPLAETPSGHLKHNLGFRRFLGRGLRRVTAETRLIFIGCNIKKIVTHLKWLAEALALLSTPAIDSG